MERVAKFEKVSFKQFTEDWIKAVIAPQNREVTQKDMDEIQAIYDNIKLPTRATAGSAGYDIFAPVDIHIPEKSYVNMPTGIRCKIEDGWVLTAYPRSGHGFKCGIRLANTVGVIDSDYYNATNEGHIFVKLGNESVLGHGSTVCINQGDAFCQGIFLPYGTTEDDEATAVRVGGFGSTSAKQ